MAGPSTARFADWIRRYFGTKAGESVNVLSDVMPVANLLEEAPELRYYRNERRYVGFASCAAGGAATYATIQFRVPATSDNRLFVIDKVACIKATAGLVLAALETAATIGAVGSLLNVNVLDTRCLADPSIVTLPTVDLGYNTTTPAAIRPAANRIDTWSVGASTLVWSPWFAPVVLHPGGGGLQIQNAAANESLDVYVQVYDVPLHGSEET